MKKEDIIRLEFKLGEQSETSQKVVKQLMEENASLKKDVEDVLKLKDKEKIREVMVDDAEKKKMLKDINDLIVEIDNHRLENLDKEKKLDKINQENHDLHEEMKHLDEVQKSTNYESRNVLEDDRSDVKSLEEELSASEYSSDSSDCYECKECGANFMSKDYLKKHMKVHVKDFTQRMLEVENKRLSQNAMLTKSLLNLKEQEIFKKGVFRRSPHLSPTHHNHP